jgi:hypothetical protein
MSIYFALLIPLIVTGIFYYFNKREYAWWEFFVPIAVVLISIVISKLVIDHVAVQFDEYWGSSVVSAYEEEPYNYWKHETCTRTYACGSDSKGNTQWCTETYDCSHQEDVDPCWWIKTNLGEVINISECQYEEIIRQFNTGKHIIKERRNYAPNDRCSGSRGTKFEGKRVGLISYVYETKWDGSDNTRKPYVSQHSYENRIKASDLTIFNISLITDKQADTLGLFKYPEYKSGFFGSNNQIGLEYPTILGGNVSKDIQEKFKRLNGKFGVSNQLRLWVLVFENKPMSIAYSQENYWVKGNMNELVVCIGKKGNEIQWSHAFSWALSDVLTVEAKNKVLELYTYKDSVVKKQLPQVLPVDKKTKQRILGKAGDKLPNVLPVPKQVSSVDTTIRVKSKYPVLNEQTWNEYYDYLDKNLNKYQRRSFKEFDYIDVEPSTLAKVIVFIIALIISIGVNLWVINNDIWDENNMENRNRWRY